MPPDRRACRFMHGEDVGMIEAAAARASCSKRRSRSGSALKATGSTLIATLDASRGSRARYTSPMPPAPINVRIS